MTIAQALKEKNKKAAKINKLWQKLYSYNSTVVDSEKPYDLDKVWDELHKETSELIELKTRIHAASAPVRSEIFSLSELKSHVSRIQSINTNKGKQTNHYRSESPVIEMTAHFDIKWKDTQIETLEQTIETIQEKLDTFNHTTQI
jgi:uncharacterized protein YfkK (UPF0435 family)